MKKRKRLIIGIVALLLFGWVMVFLWSKSRKAEDQFNLVKPATTTISKKTIATGSIEPRDEVLIKPQISGIISQILREPGDRVKAGEVLARIRIVPDIGSLNNAQSQLNLSELRLERIKTEFLRVKELYDSKVISREEFDAKQSEYSLAQEEVESAKNNLEIVQTGIMSRGGDLGNTQIRATVSGVVLSVPVKVGNSVIQANTFNEGTTIASVADMTDMIFRGSLDETEVGKIRVGTPAVITIGAMRDDTLSATVEYISPKGEIQNGVVMFEIKAAVHIPSDRFIRSGYSANAEMVTDRRDSVMAIDESAVQFDRDKAFVEVLTSDTLATKKRVYERKDVTLGLSDGIKVEVLTGLEGTELLKGTKKAFNAEKK